jgi:DNA-binding NtrC family response regulator
MSPPQAIEAPDHHALTVLIADASSEVLDSMRAAVTNQLPGAAVIEARNGNEALAILRTNTVSAALIDIALPIMSGAEVMAQSRREGRRPFLVLTSSVVVPHWAVLSTELAAYEYIKKPFMNEDLENLFRNFAVMQQPTRVLIADGSDHTRSMVRKIVASCRFRTDIQETDNGGYALKLARMQPFGLALIDAHVTGLSGLETACQLQSQHPDMTVVSILPMNDRTIAQSLKHLGLAHSLQKPFFTRDVDVLLHTIHKLRRPYLMNAVLKAASQIAS